MNEDVCINSEFELSKTRVGQVIDLEWQLKKMVPNLQIDIEGHPELQTAYRLLGEAINNVILEEARLMLLAERSHQINV